MDRFLDGSQHAKCKESLDKNHLAEHGLPRWKGLGDYRMVNYYNNQDHTNPPPTPRHYLPYCTVRNRWD